jgi:hypothetical protein
VNAHREHIHISVDADPALYDDARPWAISAVAQPTGDRMRFIGITATVFGGPSDSMSGQQTAYQTPGDWWNRPGVALPARINGPRPLVRVVHQGRSVDCEIVDVGPWNDVPGDRYWETGTRPKAEQGLVDDHGRVPTNKAGIDLTPAAANAIGLQGKGLVDWDFVDHLAAIDGDVLEPLPPPVAAPADAASPLLLILLLTLLTKEKPMTDQPTTGQGQPDLAKVLLPLILQSVISGKPIDAKDLLPVLLQGIMGVPLALPAPAPVAPQPPTQPAAPAAPQGLNDILLPLLLQLIGGKQPSAPAAAPPAAPTPVPAAPATPTSDAGATALGGIGALTGAVGALTGIAPLWGDGASTMMQAVTTISSILGIVGAAGGVSPVVSILGKIAGGLFSAFASRPK